MNLKELSEELDKTVSVAHHYRQHNIELQVDLAQAKHEAKLYLAWAAVIGLNSLGLIGYFLFTLFGG